MFLSLKTVKHSLKLSANCYRGFSTPPSFNFLTDKPQPHHDLTFIRHAESMFNQACEDYRKTHNIPYVWK